LTVNTKKQANAATIMTYIFVAPWMALLVLLLSQFFCGGVHGGRLTERWKMEGPRAIWETHHDDDKDKSQTYPSGAFLVEFIVSDFVRYPEYTLYQKNCRDELPNQGAQVFVSANLRLVPGVESKRHQSLVMEVSPNNKASNSRRTPLEFCLKIGLWTGPNDDANVEANFRETDIKVTFAQAASSDGDTLRIENVELEPKALGKVSLLAVQLAGQLRGCGGEDCKEKEIQSEA
jgi:hypothetical protein